MRLTEPPPKPHPTPAAPRPPCMPHPCTPHPAAALVVQQGPSGFAPVALVALPCGLEGEPELVALALQAAQAWAAQGCPGWGVLELGAGQRFRVRHVVSGGHRGHEAAGDEPVTSGPWCEQPPRVPAILHCSAACRLLHAAAQRPRCCRPWLSCWLLWSRSGHRSLTAASPPAVRCAPRRFRQLAPPLRPARAAAASGSGRAPLWTAGPAVPRGNTCLLGGQRHQRRRRAASAAAREAGAATRRAARPSAGACSRRSAGLCRVPLLQHCQRQQRRRKTTCPSSVKRSCSCWRSACCRGLLRPGPRMPPRQWARQAVPATRGMMPTLLPGPAGPLLGFAAVCLWSRLIPWWATLLPLLAPHPSKPLPPATLPSESTPRPCSS